MLPPDRKRIGPHRTRIGGRTARLWERTGGQSCWRPSVHVWHTRSDATHKFVILAHDDSRFSDGLISTCFAIAHVVARLPPTHAARCLSAIDAVSLTAARLPSVTTPTGTGAGRRRSP